MRTLILLSICAFFAVVAAWESKRKNLNRSTNLRHALVGFGVGLIFCWFLVRVVGIFHDWKWSFGDLLR